jgi:hypothetical protein
MGNRIRLPLEQVSALNGNPANPVKKKTVMPPRNKSYISLRESLLSLPGVNPRP